MHVSNSEHDDRASRRIFWVTAASLFAVLLIDSLVQANIPAVNEPHYLTKARHVWNADWCERDLFLQSSNPHLVFYRTVGWLAAVFPFPVAALLGRILAYGLVAYGWTRLAKTLTGQSRVALVSGGLFVGLASVGNWSGEWLVGGVESKVFSYGFAFWSIAAALGGRIRSAGLLMGLAVSFHPVVGAWSTLAIAAAVWAHCTAWVPNANWAGLRPRVWLLGGALFALAAAPGLIPAVQLLGAGTPAETLEAARYQVTKRLAHHMNPMEFSSRAYLYFGVLIAAFAALAWRWRGPYMDRKRSLVVAVAASLLFAGVGVLLGFGLPSSDLAVKLLKFYPFRLADTLVPFSVSLMAGDMLVRNCPRKVANALWLTVAALAIAIPAQDRDASRFKKSTKEAWGDACWWIRTETPEDALVLTADAWWAFKWFAQRAEYVNYKDCPQDPASIAEFRARRRYLYEWSTEAQKDLLISNEDVRRLVDGTGVTHIIAYRFGPFEAQPAYENEFFRVYDVAALSSGQ